MLSLDGILKVARLNEQCGPPEDTFSPRWHENNPYPQQGSADIAALQDQTIGKMPFVIDYRIDPTSGYRRLVRIPVEGAEPEGTEKENDQNVTPDMYIDDATGQIKEGIFVILPEEDNAAVDAEEL